MPKVRRLRRYRLCIELADPIGELRVVYVQARDSSAAVGYCCREWPVMDTLAIWRLRGRHRIRVW